MSYVVVIRASWMLKSTVCSEFTIVGPCGTSLVVEHGSLGGGDDGWSTQRAHLVSRQGWNARHEARRNWGAPKKSCVRELFMWIKVHD